MEYEDENYDDEELSKSESLHETVGSGSGSSHLTQSGTGTGSSNMAEDLGGISRSLKKSVAFHDRSTLEQQVKKL